MFRLARPPCTRVRHACGNRFARKPRFARVLRSKTQSPRPRVAQDVDPIRHLNVFSCVRRRGASWFGSLRRPLRMTPRSNSDIITRAARHASGNSSGRDFALCSNDRGPSSGGPECRAALSAFAHGQAIAQLTCRCSSVSGAVVYCSSTTAALGRNGYGSLTRLTGVSGFAARCH